MTKQPTPLFDRIGYLFGCFIGVSIWLYNSMLAAQANTPQPPVTPPIAFIMPNITASMLLATIIGAIGGYLAFGEDKKFPPSATSVGHVLLGLGAGLFFTRGSLELMGRLNSSEDMIMLVSFLWAVGGYFVLRLGIAVINSERIKDILPDWLANFLGVQK